jgi:hypothetical protein
MPHDEGESSTMPHDEGEPTTMPHNECEPTTMAHDEGKTPLCLGKVQFLRLAAKEHKRRWAARRRGTTTVTGGTGKGQQGDRRHGNGGGRHDDGDGWHDDGRHDGRRQGAAE